jgi:hypothetical protein
MHVLADAAASCAAAACGHARSGDARLVRLERAQWRDARTRGESRHAHASQEPGSGGANTEHHERTCRALISSMAARLTPWSRLCMRIFLTAKVCPVCLCLTFHTTPNEPSPSLTTFSYLSAIFPGGLPLLQPACFLVTLQSRAHCLHQH